MKKVFSLSTLLFLCSVVSTAQTQIGEDIDGEGVYDQSGHSISLSPDGTVVAIGAPYNNGKGQEAGHVRIYKNTSGTWTQVGNDIDGDSAYNKSGYSVSLSSDGTVVAIGTYDYNGKNTSILFSIK